MSGLPDLDRWVAIVERRLGLACDAWQRERLGRLLERRRAELEAAASIDAPWERLPAALRRAIAEELTIGETYFFREAAQIEAAVGFAIPERARAAGGRPVRVLSAGCSSGEELYSIAMLLSERGTGGTSAEVVLHGIDVSAAAVQLARRGQYSAWSLRAAPEAARARWFRAKGDQYEMDPALRRGVTFEERNLLDPDQAFWAPGSYDIIFCRNLFIYFSDRAIRAALDQLAGALSPGGFLMVASSESVRGLSDAFEPIYVGDALCHRRRDDKAPAARPRATPAPAPAQAPAAEHWLEAIRRSSERIAALLPGDRPAAPRAPALASAGGAGLDPEIALAAAAILSEEGRLPEAAAICERLLEGGAPVAGAHYLLGLCREHEGSAARAAEHHREAVRIDAGFALAWLRLGILARRAGDHAGARRAMEQAAARLAQEPESRIARFGSGFRRDALLELCREELKALGGAR